MAKKREQKHVVIYEETHTLITGIKTMLRGRGYNVRSIDSVIKYLIAQFITNEAEKQRSNVRTMRLNAPDEDMEEYEDGKYE